MLTKCLQNDFEQNHEKAIHDFQWVFFSFHIPTDLCSMKNGGIRASESTVMPPLEKSGRFGFLLSEIPFYRHIRREVAILAYRE